MTHQQNRLNYNENEIEEELLLLEELLEQQEKDLDRLNKWVRDGNGHTSLLVRVAQLEQFTSYMDTETQQLEETYSSLKASVFSATIALIPAIMALTLALSPVNLLFDSSTEKKDSSSPINRFAKV